MDGTVPGGRRRRRDGCSECKRKKVRCDLQRPVCVRCVRYPKECLYEAKFIIAKNPPRENAAPLGCETRSAWIPLNDLAAQPQHVTLVQSPLLASTTCRFLMHHFGTQTAPVLFPLAPTAFKQRLVSTAVHTSHLFYALLASACSHHARLIGVEALQETAQVVLRFTHLAVAGLKDAMADPKQVLRVETAMTAMALCTNDVCDGSDTQQWRVHLAGVKALLDVFSKEERRRRDAGVVDPFAEYLAKWFATMNTAAGVSGLHEGGVGDCSEESWPLLESGTAGKGEVDDFCGYDLQLMPVLAKVGKFARLRQNLCGIYGVEELTRMQEFVGVAEDMEAEILSFAYSVDLKDTSVAHEAPRSRELRATNLAFIHAALLHLHCRVMLLPKHHGKVREDVQSILDAIDSISISSPTNILVLWPIFSAGCETDDAQQRATIDKRMSTMQNLGMGNYKRAREVLLTYWSSYSPLRWDVYMQTAGLSLVLF